MRKSRKRNRGIKREAIKELRVTLITQIIAILALGTLTITMMVMHYCDEEIKDAERQLNLEDKEYNIYTEYVPVKEQMARYIDSLPMPKAEIPQLILEEEDKEAEVKEQKPVEKVEIPKEATKVTKATSLSDVELLASLMYHEEGKTLSEVPFEDAKRAHMLAGSVVLHRTNMNYKGAQSIRETIYAKGQYAQSTLNKLDEPVPDYVIEWARELIENGPIGPSDMIYQAEFEQGKGTYEHIYNQYFCTINEIQP